MIGLSLPPASTEAVRIGMIFAERLERVRGLTPEESAMLARLVAHGLARRPLRRWPFAQDAPLHALSADGPTAAEIATAIGRTTDAIYTRINRLKQQDRQETPA